MNTAQHFKRMVLDKEFELDPALESIVLNDQLTERDIAFMILGYQNRDDVNKLLNQSEEVNS